MRNAAYLTLLTLLWVAAVTCFTIATQRLVTL